jgi:hypothetical protein
MSWDKRALLCEDGLSGGRKDWKRSLNKMVLLQPDIAPKHSSKSRKCGVRRKKSLADPSILLEYEAKKVR